MIKIVDRKRLIWNHTDEHKNNQIPRDQPGTQLHAPFVSARCAIGARIGREDIILTSGCSRRLIIPKKKQKQPKQERKPSQGVVVRHTSLALRQAEAERTGSVAGERYRNPRWVYPGHTGSFVFRGSFFGTVNTRKIPYDLRVFGLTCSTLTPC
jgi:hypothetical protein